MTEIPERARVMIDAARLLDEPTAVDRARVRARLTAAIAGAGALAGAQQAAASPAAVGGTTAPLLPGRLLAVWSKSSLGAKLSVHALLFTLSAAATTGVIWMRSASEPAPHIAPAVRAPASAPQPAGAAGPDIEPPALEVQAVEAESQPNPAPELEAPKPNPRDRGAPPKRSKRRVAPAPPPEEHEELLAEDNPAPPPPSPPASAAPAAAPVPLGMGGELALLAAAQRALAAGDLIHALGMLDQHAARYPSGNLAPERWAARAATLCRMGRRAEGTRELQTLEANAPKSPLLSWARGYCRRD